MVCQSGADSRTAERPDAAEVADERGRPHLSELKSSRARSRDAASFRRENVFRIVFGVSSPRQGWTARVSAMPLNPPPSRPRVRASATRPTSRRRAKASKAKPKAFQPPPVTPASSASQERAEHVQHDAHLRSAAYDSARRAGRRRTRAEADAKERRDPTPAGCVRSEADREEGVEARGLVGVQLEDRPLEDDGAANMSDPATPCTRAARRSPSARRVGQRRPAASAARRRATRRGGRRRPGLPARRYHELDARPRRVQRAERGPARSCTCRWRETASSAFATRTKRSGGYQANKEGTPGPRSCESKRPCRRAAPRRRLAFRTGRRRASAGRGRRPAPTSAPDRQPARR